MSEIISEIEDLKIIYKDIIDGCSLFEEKNVFVKHLTEIENGELLKRKSFLYNKFKKEGLPTEQERLIQLRKDEDWDDEKEDKIVSCQFVISDNEKNIIHIIPEQQTPIRKIIEKKKEELKHLQAEKSVLIGPTAEDYAEKHSFHYMLFLSFYEDVKCEKKVFQKYEELEELDDTELIPFVEILEQSFKKINEKKIKKISILPFFLNNFSYCKDSVYHFIGKPLAYLTAYQLLLFSLGNRNLNINSQSEGEPPELFGETRLDDIVNWYDRNYSIMLTKRHKGKN